MLGFDFLRNLPFKEYLKYTRYLIPKFIYDKFVASYELYWLYAIVIISLFVIPTRVYKFFVERDARFRFKKIAKEIRDKQSKQIDEFLKSHKPPRKELFDAIKKASVNEIVQNTKSGKWKVVDVVLTFCHCASASHNQTNCLTEILFDYALEKAKELDNRNVKEGILFGVPISIKDHFNISGFPSSVGIFKWKDDIMNENELIIQHILDAGAIPFCKTNVPQTMMSFECGNPLWGITENPNVKGYSPGGSSGGEAALIGSGGSVLGLGSDIGGSLRIPAHFSGICSLKPSSYRVPRSGGRKFHPSSILIHPVTGPMAKSVDDLIPLLNVIIGKSDIDVPPSEAFKALPLDDNRKLKYGVIRKISFLEPLLPCTRALEESITALKAAGHEVVEFEFPFPIAQVISLFYETISADGAEYYIRSLRGEPIEETLKPFIYLLQKSNTLLGIFAYIASAYTDKRPMIFLDSLGKKDAIRILKMSGERHELISKMNMAWKQAGIDCLLMPAFPTPATPHNSFPHVSFAASYTFIWNVLDYVAGIVPVSKVNPELDQLGKELTPDDMDNNTSARLLEAELENCYNANRMAGLSLGVQIVTPQFCEAEAIRCMRALERSLTH